jgi:hypothetical protein
MDKLNVFPAFAFQNTLNLGPANAIVSRQLVNRTRLGSIQLSNLAHVLLSQFCSAVILALRKSFWVKMPSMLFPPRLTAFVNHIGGVDRWCAKKQVSRIAAQSIVTFMADQEPVGNYAISQCVTYAVNRVSVIVDGDSAVTIRNLTRLPFPTIVGVSNFNFRPKALNIFRGILDHAVPPIRHRAVGRGNAANGTFDSINYTSKLGGAL